MGMRLLILSWRYIYVSMLEDIVDRSVLAGEHSNLGIVIGILIRAL
jgi:hypothetical protein